MDTSAQYDRVIKHCQQLFTKKNADYGTAWRIMRPPSITDQLYIKAQRIRTLEEKKVSKVGEEISDEYLAIVNYCVMGIMQLELGAHGHENLSTETIIEKYEQAIRETKELMFAKNHDYGEAWRDMRLTSLTDLILMKIYRVKQIEDNRGQTLVSEGVKANYQDMLNYAVFALIKLDIGSDNI
ncbi:DUF1599 domain-containing protein [Parapedobacter sp. DT-150]|uniref:DUF1599 domain-containing protein n=1 Tax=Parapedobacter sp. DT-150 TaxID=3396162 RepID=UPI003F1DD09E